MSRPPAGAVPAEPARDELRVQGVLDLRWPAWFDGLQLSSDQAGQTTIAGPVADQAALHGLLAEIRDLGLPLMSVHRLDPDRRPTWRQPCNQFPPRRADPRPSGCNGSE